MVETHSYRKSRVNLEDYDYLRDIQNRLLLAHLTVHDLEILEEIIYSPTQFSIDTLACQTKKSEKQLFETLTKLRETDLFKIKGTTLLVDKEVRKYFEIQIARFEESFKPGMEFLQSLLKKVPIHLLPNWYPIPRTSNNIFESLIEKYFETPQKFQRYLAELTFNDEMLESIVDDLFAAPNYRLYSKDICKKYSLSEEEFEKCMLQLEFNFLCCLVFERKGNRWLGVVTLFQEWKDYLHFLQQNRPCEIQVIDEIEESRPQSFAFVEDMSIFLTVMGHRDFFVKLDSKERWVPDKSIVQTLIEKCEGFDLETEKKEQFFTNYVNQVIKKLLFLRLANIEKSRVFPTEAAKEWLKTPIQKRALSTYKMTISQYPFSEFSQAVCTERNIHEIEKSIGRIIGLGWVFLDDFLKGVTAPISENSKMMLTKTGRHWRYAPPHYSDEETFLIRKVTFDWLFEGGMISTGECRGKPCLQITPFGRSIFA